MPYLKIQTNVEIPNRAELATKASKITAEALSKPEQYMMVAVENRCEMSFAGESDKPAVFFELKSIGLQANQTSKLSEILCNFAKSELKIDQARVYIEFTNAQGEMWGWNCSTF